MFPISHLIAYFVKDSSEIVSDALTMYVNYTNLNNVHMEINRGKDLNQDTVEVKGYATPGSYLSFNVLHADLYKYGAVPFLREYDVSYCSADCFSEHALPVSVFCWMNVRMNVLRNG